MAMLYKLPKIFLIAFKKSFAFNSRIFESTTNGALIFSSPMLEYLFRIYLSFAVAANAPRNAILSSFLFMLFSFSMLFILGGCAFLPPLVPEIVAPIQKNWAPLVHKIGANIKKNWVPLIHIIFLGILNIPFPDAVFPFLLACLSCPLADF